MVTTKYTSTLIAVSDMEKSKQFYRDVLGKKVVADFGANVTLDGGLVLQTLDTWTSFIRTDKVVLPNNEIREKARYEISENNSHEEWKSVLLA